MREVLKDKQNFSTKNQIEKKFFKILFLENETIPSARKL